MSQSAEVDSSGATVEHGILDEDSPSIAGASFDYDLLVIGGGSGGISAAKIAGKAGKRVALCDFIVPSPQGSSWGLGGTCVNVGCIPKKLMHQSALIGEAVHHAASSFGWGAHKEDKYNDQYEIVHDPVPEIDDWSRLVGNIQNHIRSLNWGYSSELMKNGVEYINAFATFNNDESGHNRSHSLSLTSGDGTVRTVTARRVIVATGGRPTIPDNLPGAREHCITSDDLFSRRNKPGKTLLVGAGYIALECGGFINGMGFEAALMVRSTPLRGFDVDMARKITASMKGRGVRFIEKAVPLRIDKRDEDGGRLLVTYRVTTDDGSNTESSELFDTVVLATGRTAETGKLNLPAAGVRVDAHTQKILVDHFDRSTAPHVYAVGDVVHGRPELMPVALNSGKLLGTRLYIVGPKFVAEGKSLTENLPKDIFVDYDKIPTAVFTPIEYGLCGLSEEQALEKYGWVEVYHINFTPLEWTISHQGIGANECYMKIIVNPFNNEEVLGFHVMCPNAGEMTLGVAIAMRCGVTKAQLDATIGIHPTIAEELVRLSITKSSGEDPNKGGC